MKGLGCQGFLPRFPLRGRRFRVGLRESKRTCSFEMLYVRGEHDGPDAVCGSVSQPGIRVVGHRGSRSKTGFLAMRLVKLILIVFIALLVNEF